MWIEVFKTGEQTDSDGNKKNWTFQDLSEIAKIYNAQTEHEAPIVIGHPDTDKPAYGWVESLKADANTLFAKLKEINTEFKEMVNSGAFKKRSISLYPSNLLRHIGFLGATPPAVKGLKDFKFSSDEKDISNYEIEGTIKFQEEKPAHVITAERLASEYGIAYRDKYIKNLTSDKYSDYKSEEFGDPVNKRFPISSYSDVLASIGIWNRSDVRTEYSEKERTVINARILRLARGYKININPKNWNFNSSVEIPLETLSKNQLVNYIKVNQINNSHNHGDAEMAFKYDEFIQELAAFLSESYGEEAATQFSQKAAEIKDKYMTEESTDTPETTEDTTPEYSEEMKKMRERIEQLESEKMLDKIENYSEKLVASGKILPAQKSIVSQALLVGKRVKGFNFSETKDGKNSVSAVDGDAVIQKLIDSYPSVIDFNEQARKNETTQNDKNATSIIPDVAIDEDRQKLFNEAKELQAKAAKEGKALNFVEALHLAKINHK